MERWSLSHGKVGINAPGWLTFDVHRPYFDGGDTPLTAIQARGGPLAAELFELRDPYAPRFAMVMPSSFRRLLIEESRLRDYHVIEPSDLPAGRATPRWQMMADAFVNRAGLDETGRVCLAHWLLATCLPEAMLVMEPRDHSAEECSSPLTAAVQLARAKALAMCEGPSARTEAAYRALIDAPKPSIGQMGALGGWAYQLARHRADDDAVPSLTERADQLLRDLEPDMTPFERGIHRGRRLISQVMHAERTKEFDRAAGLLAEAESVDVPALARTGEDRAAALEYQRRLIDRTVEIAVRTGDVALEERTLAEGLSLDPYCIKIRMQHAQFLERAGETAAALEEYLWAAQLGPFGTAFALMGAARCAKALERSSFERVLLERAARSAPGSQRVQEALAAACGDDEPLAEVARSSGNWHYRMYGAYFNLGHSHSPCMYARLPTMAYEFAVAGSPPKLGAQRVMPPAFRGNLIRESGLSEFAAERPAELPADLRTPEWDRVCAWTAGLAESDPLRQLLTIQVLTRLGFHREVTERVPERPMRELTEPVEFNVQHSRDMAGYVSSVGRGRRTPPRCTLEIVENPLCPPLLRLKLAVFGVVVAARETKAAAEAARWRAPAEELLAGILASAEYSPFEKAMLESRFYRGVSFVPFLEGDRAAVIDELDRAETLARAVPAETEWERFLKFENLHALLESRSKEAFGLGQIEIGHKRTLEFLALDPYDPKSHIEHGESLMRQERYVEAGDAYLRAARLGPLGTAIAYSMAGECFERAGQRILAADCFLQSLRIDPYAISGARGWQRTAGDGAKTLAREYEAGLKAWADRQTTKQAG